jgi:hydrogenase nickel incorporation protein HypA/HybF
MHELAITTSIVELACEAAAGRRIERVTIEVGALAGVLTDSIAFCFEEVTRGSLADGAVLDIHHIPASARCRGCGQIFEMTALWSPCACGSLDIERLRGGELNIKSIEGRVAA